jgi:cyclic pyranopterin phosphate synthase
MSGEFTHFDATGNAMMVDVTGKAITEREAVAHCVVNGIVRARGETDAHRLDEALAMAKVAAMLGAKQTSRLIPLCHPLPLTSTSVSFNVSSASVEIVTIARTNSQTGVEMEALTACAVAALTLVSSLGEPYSGCEIDDLSLLQKSGGRSGLWEREHLEVVPDQPLA